MFNGWSVLDISATASLPEDPNPQQNLCCIIKSCIIGQLCGRTWSVLSFPSQDRNEPLQSTLWKMSTLFYQCVAFRWETNFYIRTLKKVVMVEDWKTSGELWIFLGRIVRVEENYDKHNDRTLWQNAWIKGYKLDTAMKF